MDRKFKGSLGAMCALLCALCVSKAASAQALPDGKGKTEFVHNCTACHRADMVTRAKKTPDEWRKSVDDMAARGTDGSKADLDNVVLYLVANYSTDKPAAAAATPSTTASPSAAPATQNSSELEYAKRIVADNGCLTCHRIEQHGGYTAPSLNGVSARSSAGEIRTAIVSPIPTLNPGNILARLTTSDGTTLVGRLLSQDDQQVQIVNAFGDPITYSKAELTQFTVIDTNPMPSFEKKITGDDLDVLVRYLVALPPVSASAQK